ncbi:hypothetical protein [Actinomadura hibisca]|uniref:hypothetical protein n=1 Tax=Actinomadura hibisca TaxID=68565 RepID=UPI000AAB49BC|nr:hypothetical protein [Actinomadura hibisca]
MAGDERLTALDYELFILRTMVDAPAEQVGRVLEGAGVSRDVMERAYQRVEQENFILRPAFNLISEILGPPRSEERRAEAGREFVVRTFPLRLWSEFDLEVYGRSDGMVWDERFVRAVDARVPRVDAPSQLSAWAMTKAEAENRFGPLEEIDLWPPYGSYGLAYRSPDGVVSRYRVVFSRALLQSVEVE